MQSRKRECAVEKGKRAAAAAATGGNIDCRGRCQITACTPGRNRVVGTYLAVVYTRYSDDRALQRDCSVFAWPG